MSRIRRNKSLDLDLQVEGPKKIHEIFYNGTTSNVLNSQAIKYNTSELQHRGTDTGLIQIDNAGSFTKFTSLKKVRIVCSKRVALADGSGTGAIQFYINETNIMSGNEVEGTGSIVHGNVTLILHPGEYFSIRIPTGVPSAASFFPLRLIAESLEETISLSDLIEE